MTKMHSTKGRPREKGRHGRTHAHVYVVVGIVVMDTAITEGESNYAYDLIHVQYEIR